MRVKAGGLSYNDMCKEYNCIVNILSVELKPKVKLANAYESPCWDEIMVLLLCIPWCTYDICQSMNKLKYIIL